VVSGCCSLYCPSASMAIDLTTTRHRLCPSIIAWLVMMGVLAAVLFTNARRRWVLAIAGLGIAVNVLVIGLNGAMPVSLRATSEIGIPRATARVVLAADCLHEAMTSETRLPVLGDVIGVPGSRWQRGVVSIGDLLLAGGLAAWVAVASRSRAADGAG